jgi:hypothetical protein
MKNEKITNSDIDQWLDNDESLYNWLKSSRQNRRQFIKDNRDQLVAYIDGIINQPPQAKTWQYYC